MTLLRIVSLAVLVSTVFAASYVGPSENKVFHSFLAEHHQMNYLKSDLMTITSDVHNLMVEFNKSEIIHLLSSGDENKARIMSRMNVVLKYYSKTSSLVSSSNSSQLSKLAMNLVANNRGGIEQYFDSKHLDEEAHGHGEERHKEDFLNLFWPQQHGVSEELVSLSRSISEIMLRNSVTHAKVLKIMKRRFILKQKVMTVFSETSGRSQVLVQSHMFSRVTWDEVENNLNGDAVVMHGVMMQEVTSLLLLNEERLPATCRHNHKEVHGRSTTPAPNQHVSGYFRTMSENDVTPVKEYPIPSNFMSTMRNRVRRLYLEGRHKLTIHYLGIMAIAVVTCAGVTAIILLIMAFRSRAANKNDLCFGKSGYSLLKE